MKNLRALFLLFAANIVSGFAQGITMLAIPWYLVSDLGEQEGKFLNASMVAVVTLISLFWGIYAGSLIDKYNRKHIFQVLNGADFLILISAGLFAAQFEITPFPLIAVVFGITIFTYNVHYPNLYAFVQELFEPQYYSKVNSAIELQGQFTNALGMFLGGVLLVGTQDMPFWPEALAFERWELYEIFLLDGSTYLLSFILIGLIPYRMNPDRKVDQGSTLGRIRMGFDYLWQKKPLLIFGISSHLIFFSLLVIIQVLLPVYVSDYLQADAYVMAQFKGIYAIGAVSAGAIGLAFVTKKQSTIQQIIFLMLLVSLVYFVCATTHSIVLTLIGAFMVGICNAGTRILRITYIVHVVPNYVIGRVNSFFMVVNVMMRLSFITLMTIPFFSGEGNGSNIIYAFFLLGLITLSGALVLITRFKTFDREDSTIIPGATG